MIVVISSSTGGPDALKALFKGLGDKSTPPMIVVQHMKAGITASLTKRLGEISKATVLEITDGMVLKKGHVYVCPGGYNVTLEKNGTASGLSLLLHRIMLRQMLMFCWNP